MKKDFQTRYWSNIRKTDTCWIWEGKVTKHGYGSFWWNEQGIQGAHRVAFFLANGYVPKGNKPEDLCVCHTCDNGLCVNPEHLFPGTRRDNVLDMVAKNRNSFKAPIGEKNGHSKLSEYQVRAIRRKRKLGITMARLARDFGVSEGAVAHICHSRTWKHLLTRE